MMAFFHSSLPNFELNLVSKLGAKSNCFIIIHFTLWEWLAELIKNSLSTQQWTSEYGPTSRSSNVNNWKTKYVQQQENARLNLSMILLSDNPSKLSFQVTSSIWRLVAKNNGYTKNTHHYNSCLPLGCIRRSWSMCRNRKPLPQVWRNVFLTGQRREHTKGA